MKPFIKAMKMLLVMTVITGLIYPVIITLVAQAAFPLKANGSIVRQGSQVAGSRLIGQNFGSAIYIWPRPSATGYDPLPSGASNEPLDSKSLHSQVQQRTEFFMNENGIKDPSKIPSEMIFASASGLDPEISPEAALLQLDRVCIARHWGPVQRFQAEKLISELTQKQQFLLFGERRINVLMLNLSLDKIH